jgi:hypothetical protein
MVELKAHGQEISTPQVQRPMQYARVYAVQSSLICPHMSRVPLTARTIMSSYVNCMPTYVYTPGTATMGWQLHHDAFIFFQVNTRAHIGITSQNKTEIPKS